MLVVMNANATEAEIAGVVRVIEALGLRAHTMPGATRTAIGITGNKGAISLQHFENLPGVAEAIRVSKPYKLITLDLKQDRTIVDIGGAKIGNGSLAMIAGPCAIETRQQTFAIAEVVKKSGAKFFRGGAFKPRTSPYAFAGLGEEGLKILVEVRDKFDLRIVSEALDEPGVDLVEKYADMIQIGARNMQNYTLLAAGRAFQAAGVAQARDGRDPGGMVARGRIHHVGRQLPSRSLRTRCPHLCPAHPQHPRSRGRAGSATYLAFARHRRRLTWNRPKLHGHPAGARRSCGRRRWIDG